MSTLDLSLVPVPDAIKPLSVEQVIARMKSDFLRDNPSFASVLELESEPVVALINQFSYRESLIRAECNEMVRSMTLAHARGVNLDAKAADYNTVRLEGESDDALRERCLLAFASMSTAGSKPSYIYHARSAHPDVKQVNALRSDPGHIQIVVLAHSGDGVPSSEVIAAVSAAITVESTRPLGDLSDTVLPVALIDYTIRADIDHDPSFNTVPLELSVAQFVAEAKKIKRPLRRSELFGLLHVPGVLNVTLHEPAQDIVPTDYQAPSCSDIALNFAVSA